MPETLRFHLDESLSPTIARAARLRGMDITDSHTEGMLSQADIDQWKFCQAQGRILITSDADFLRIASTDPGHHGIVFCLTNRIGAIVRKLELLATDVSPEAMRGHTEFLR